MTDPKQQRWRTVRDVTIFALGLVGVIHELFFTSLDRPALLVLCAACMGLAVKLRNGDGVGK